ncbi:hypothetical protein ACWDUM_25990 [Rhodococcus sp. NPDC003322]
MLLDAVGEAAAHKMIRYVTLDVFNVTIDGNADLVTIDDELDVTRSTEVELSEFKSAILRK